MRTSANQRGFTLPELILSITIGTLATMAIMSSFLALNAVTYGNEDLLVFPGLSDRQVIASPTQLGSIDAMTMMATFLEDTHRASYIRAVEGDDNASGIVADYNPATLSFFADAGTFQMADHGTTGDPLLTLLKNQTGLINPSPWSTCILLMDDTMGVLASYQIYRQAATDNTGEAYFIDEVVRRVPGEDLANAMSYEVAQPQTSFHPTPGSEFFGEATTEGVDGPHYRLTFPDPSYIPTKNRPSNTTYTIPMFP